MAVKRTLLELKKAFDEYLSLRRLTPDEKINREAEESILRNISAEAEEVDGGLEWWEKHAAPAVTAAGIISTIGLVGAEVGMPDKYRPSTIIGNDLSRAKEAFQSGPPIELGGPKGLNKSVDPNDFTTGTYFDDIYERYRSGQAIELGPPRFPIPERLKTPALEDRTGAAFGDIPRSKEEFDRRYKETRLKGREGTRKLFQEWRDSRTDLGIKEAADRNGAIQRLWSGAENSNPINFEDFSIEDIGNMGAERIKALLGYAGAAAGAATTGGLLALADDGEAGFPPAVNLATADSGTTGTADGQWRPPTRSLLDMLSGGEHDSWLEYLGLDGPSAVGQSRANRLTGIMSGRTNPMASPPAITTPMPWEVPLDPAGEMAIQENPAGALTALEMMDAPAYVDPFVGVEDGIYTPEDMSNQAMARGYNPANIISDEMIGPAGPSSPWYSRLASGMGNAIQNNPGIALSSLGALMALVKGDNPSQRVARRVMNRGPSYEAVPFNNNLTAFAHGGKAGAPYEGGPVENGLVGEAGLEWVGPMSRSPIKGKALDALLNIDNPGHRGTAGLTRFANGGYVNPNNYMEGEQDWGKMTVWNRMKNSGQSTNSGRGYADPGAMGARRVGPHGADAGPGSIEGMGLGGSGSDTSGITMPPPPPPAATPPPPAATPPPPAAAADPNSGVNPNVGPNMQMFNEYSETLKEILASRGQFDPSTSHQMAWSRGMAPLMQQQQQISFDQLMQMNRFNEAQRQFGATHALQSDSLNANAASRYNPYGWSDALGDIGSMFTYYNNRSR